MFSGGFFIKRHSSSSRAFHLIMFSSFVNVLGRQWCTFPSRILCITRTPCTQRKVISFVVWVPGCSVCLSVACKEKFSSSAIAPSTSQMLCSERFKYLAGYLLSLLSMVLVCQNLEWSSWVRWQSGFLGYSWSLNRQCLGRL